MFCGYLSDMFLPSKIALTPIGGTPESINVQLGMEAEPLRACFENERESFLTKPFISIFDILIDWLSRSNLESHGSNPWTTIPDKLEFQKGNSSYV